MSIGTLLVDDLSWKDPNLLLPEIGWDVIACIGEPENLKSSYYKIASYFGSGCFEVSNGAYANSRLYASGMPNNSNAIKVLAWKYIDRFNGDFT